MTTTLQLSTLDKFLDWLTHLPWYVLILIPILTWFFHDPNRGLGINSTMVCFALSIISVLVLIGLLGSIGIRI